jgi:predicted DsbA family dithiol-disulfide isomerase
MAKITVVSAVWCPSCLILKKNLKRLQEEYPSVEINMLDYDFDEEEVEPLQVGDKLPVMIYEDKRLIGEKTYEEIIDFLKESGCL